MTDPHETLKSHVVAVLEGIRHLSVDDAADLLSEIEAELAEDRTEDAINGAILDGIRWGYCAAVAVEMGGGRDLRTLLSRRRADPVRRRIIPAPATRARWAGAPIRMQRSGDHPFHRKRTEIWPCGRVQIGGGHAVIGACA